MPDIQASDGFGSQQSANVVDATAILIAEYEYIAQTAHQTNEDRSRVANFYLVSVGSFLVAAFTTLNDSATNFNLVWAFAILFFGLSLYGFFTLLQLARLRSAWFESILAMNQIKEYCIQHSALPDLDRAFAWRGATLPARFKLASISALSALQVSVLAGIMFGTAIAYYRLAASADWLVVAVSSGVLFFVLQMVVFILIVRRRGSS